MKCYLCNKKLARRQHLEGVSARSGEIIAGGKYCNDCYVLEVCRGGGGGCVSGHRDKWIDPWMGGWMAGGTLVRARLEAIVRCRYGILANNVCMRVPPH